MTRRSSGIHAAWHFWYAASFGGESGLRKVGLYGIHPLTQRYVTIAKTALGDKSRYGRGKDQCSGISNN
ncbi:DUF3265 domain-containing protein [Vibrio vulnificus]|nr:DUF3265 domain-containing protein [Vibrio vulnificus]PUZ92135.1 DUF3265 domain-containing protein [Vibrio vulnificus]HAS6031948.1 DUF3265 domain-containing protein [Vibrio vulnificus]HAS6131228.1 DUF3265 domain-containing protein [Vibrio vulnificus]HAS6405593.1 DUF3265 domain-containing protein [Vibrio vulnificus]